MKAILVATGMVVCLGLAGCNGQSQTEATTASPVGAPSGITSSNGGGQRQLGNLPSVGVSGEGTARTRVPSGAGNSY